MTPSQDPNSWYHCRRVRRATERRGWETSGGLKSNRRMRVSIWGDVRRAIRSEHQRNLLVWLEGQFRSGITAGQLCARLVAQLRKCKDNRDI